MAYGVSSLTRNEVYRIIDSERAYQDDKWLHDQPKGVAEYLVLLDDYLAEAKRAWTRNAGDAAALEIMRKLGGIVVHCLEENGGPYRSGYEDTQLKSLLLWGRHPDFPDAKFPHRAHTTDAGVDFYAAEDVEILPGEVKRIRTGICIHPSFDKIPDGYNQPGGWTLAALAWDKSGIGGKGASVLAGVIDESYRGEVQVIMVNLNLRQSVKDLEIRVTKAHSLLSSFSNPSTSRLLEILSPSKIGLGQSITFKKGEKLTQLLIQRVELPLIADEPTPLSDTVRGAGGFGSTGK